MMGHMAAGAMMFVGGGIQLANSVRLRRRGVPWRGYAVSSTGFVANGIFAMTGVTAGQTTVSTIAMWTVVPAVWIGLGLVLVDQQRSKKALVGSRPR